MKYRACPPLYASMHILEVIFDYILQYIVATQINPHPEKHSEVKLPLTLVMEKDTFIKRGRILGDPCNSNTGRLILAPGAVSVALCCLCKVVFSNTGSPFPSVFFVGRLLWGRAKCGPPKPIRMGQHWMPGSLRYECQRHSI